MSTNDTPRQKAVHNGQLTVNQRNRIRGHSREVFELLDVEEPFRGGDVSKTLKARMDQLASAGIIKQHSRERVATRKHYTTFWTVKDAAKDFMKDLRWADDDEEANPCGHTFGFECDDGDLVCTDPRCDGRWSRDEFKRLTEADAS